MNFKCNNNNFLNFNNKLNSINKEINTLNEKKNKLICNYFSNYENYKKISKLNENKLLNYSDYLLGYVV